MQEKTIVGKKMVQREHCVSIGSHEYEGKIHYSIYDNGTFVNTEAGSPKATDLEEVARAAKEYFEKLS